MISKYVRDKNNNPTGLLVADLIDNKLRIGWAAYNVKEEKRFDKRLAYSIARSRLNFAPQNIPCRILKELVEFESRARRYYKQLN